MSKLINYYDPQMLEGSTPASTIASLKSNLLACSWQILHEDTSASPYLDVIPPSGQAIGNSLGREVIRLRAPATGNVIELWVYMETLPAQWHSPWTLMFTGSVVVDYTYGFNYFLSVMERTLILSTKTNTSTYGPIAASYADHDAAISATPGGLIPIELVGIPSFITAFVVPAITHLYGFSDTNDHVSRTITPPSEHTIPSYTATWIGCDVVTGTVGGNIGVLTNLSTFYIRSTWFDYLQIVPASVGLSGIGPNARVALGYPTMVSLGLAPSVAGVVNSGHGSLSWVAHLSGAVPGLPLPDLTVYCDAGNNEGLHLVRSLTTTTLQTTMDNSTDYPVITLGSVADLPTTGTLVIGNECFPYTGKSGSTVTGSTRGAYATARAAHSIGATVYLASWVVKINSGVHHAGTTKPGN